MILTEQRLIECTAHSENDNAAHLYNLPFMALMTSALMLSQSNTDGSAGEVSHQYGENRQIEARQFSPYM